MATRIDGSHIHAGQLICLNIRDLINLKLEHQLTDTKVYC